MEQPTVFKKKKSYWRSKTVWSGLGSIGVGIFMIVTGNIPEGILAIASGGGAIFGRAKATTVLTTKTDKQLNQ